MNILKMKKEKQSILNKETGNSHSFIEVVLIFLGGLIVLLSWTSFLLLEFGLFFTPVIYITTSLSLFLCFLLIKPYIKNLKAKRIEILVFIIILFFSIFSSIFFHDTFFGNRDEGVYTNAGILVSKNNSFKIKADLPPSFVLSKNKDWLQPSFPFGYPAWIGWHYSLFGITGVQFSNFLLILVFLLAIYTISQLLGSNLAGIFSIILLGSSYPFVWFWRRTVSENLEASLLWLAFSCFLLAVKKGKRIYLAIALFSFGYTFYTRSESILLFFIFLVFIFIYSLIIKRKLVFLYSLFLSIPLMIHYIFYIFTYKRGEINDLIQLVSTTGLYKLKIPVLNDELPAVLSNALHFHLPEFTFHILSQYSLYLPIPFIIFIALLFLFKKEFQKLGYFLLCVFTLAPLFYALKDPQIVYDQPWMLRRYIVGILPLAYLAFSLFLTKIVNKKIALFVFIIVFLNNLIISSPILFLSEYKGTINNIKKIINSIPKNSIVFVDRFIFTDYYEIDAPIFSIFDIPSIRTYSENLENTFISENSEIYFITHDNNWRNDQENFEQFFPKQSWQLVSEDIFSFKRLLRTCELLKNYGMPGLVGRLPLEQAIQECNEKPSKVENINTKIIVYKVNDEVVRDYLYKQALFKQYSKKNIKFLPITRFKREDSSLICATPPCEIRYYLPSGNTPGLLIFSEPYKFPKYYNVQVTAGGQSINYSIFDFDENQFVNIKRRFISENNLNFKADTTYFQETYVLKNFIRLKLDSPYPIRINKIEIAPVEK